MRKLILVAGLFAILQVRAEAGIWDEVGRAAKAVEFCKQKPDADSCKPVTSAMLLSRCDTDDGSARAYCYGVLDSILSSDSTRRLPEFQCVPADFWRSPEQARLLFIREARQLIDMLHYPASQMVLYAVAKSFGCIANPLQQRR